MNEKTLRYWVIGIGVLSVINFTLLVVSINVSMVNNASLGVIQNIMRLESGRWRPSNTLHRRTLYIRYRVFMAQGWSKDLGAMQWAVRGPTVPQEKRGDNCPLVTFNLDKCGNDDKRPTRFSSIKRYFLKPHLGFISRAFRFSKWADLSINTQMPLRIGQTQGSSLISRKPAHIC